MFKRIFAVGLLLWCNFALAVDPTLDWKTIESEHLLVHYAKGNKMLAERALVIAERAHHRLTALFDWQPEEKTHIVISDETDQPNGFATPIFFNRTVLFVAPPTSINTLEDFDDWFTTLIVHEYTHIIHLDKSAGSPEFLRSIFGRFLFLFPNLFQPSWVHEGLATYEETDLARGIGRGQSTMFASMMREEVAKGLQPISHVNLPVSTWPAGTTRYLYGVYFMLFIAERYGEKVLNEWIDEYSNNLLPFFINTNAKKTLGKNLTPLWAEYQQWLRERFQPQIDAIQAAGVTAGEQISLSAYRTDSVRAIAGAEGDEVYYVKNSGYQRASLMFVDAAGNIEQLHALNGSANLDLHPEAGILLTQNENCNNYTIYSDIYHYDKDSDTLSRLTECGRYLSVSWLPDGKQMIATHHDAGKMALHRLDKDGNLIEVLWRGSDSDIIGQIDVSPQGDKLVASLWRQGWGWNLELFDIAEKRWQKITHSTDISANPQFTPDGRILFSQEADGVYNLQRYDIKTQKFEQITNLIGGAFQSSQASDKGPVYYTGYSAEGFAIYSLSDVAVIDVSTMGTEENEQRLKKFDYPITVHEEREYSALSNMRPRWWFPAFQFSEQRSELGVTTAGSDALGIHNYSITGSYDFKLEKPAGRLSYAYADRLALSAARFNEITLQANEDIDRISSRNIFSAVLAFPNTYVQTSSDLLFSVVYDNKADEELSAGALPLSDFNDHLIGIAWLYRTDDLNPLSISLNDGMNLRLVAEDSDALNSDFTGQVYTLDWRQYIRTGKESVLALRFLQGWGTDQPQPFKLGGEGTDADAVSTLFGFSEQAVFDERSYALRGYKEGLPQLRGRRAQLLSGEWRFPLQRLERGIMTPPVGLMQWYGNIFVETGSAYQDTPDTYYSSAGVELSADINLFYATTLRTRVGYAHGFDSQVGDDLLYLRIGSSF